MESLSRNDSRCSSGDSSDEDFGSLQEAANKIILDLTGFQPPNVEVDSELPKNLPKQRGTRKFRFRLTEVQKLTRIVATVHGKETDRILTSTKTLKHMASRVKELLGLKESFMVNKI